MDIVSHAILGGAINLGLKEPQTRKKILTNIIFALLPDFSLFFVFFYVGFINNRPFLIPFNSDWNGFRSASPMLTALWEIPHSFFFALIIILPIILILKLPKTAFWAYCSHIFTDLFTHAGEWAVKPFFPFSYEFNGFTNAWAWNFSSMTFLWVMILASIFILNFLYKKTSKNF